MEWVVVWRGMPHVGGHAGGVPGSQQPQALCCSLLSPLRHMQPRLYTIENHCH